MPIQSPLSNLRDVLGQVKETAATYQTQFSSNEAATRLALIDPILTALGWSMSNPSMVVVENTAQSYRADYVLYDSGQSPKIVVEAKALGVSVSRGTPQLFATVGRVQQGSQQKTGFITNGLVWEHYTGQSALTNHSFIWSGDIASHDLQSIAAHLIQHLDAAQFWPQDDDTTAPEILQLQQDYAALDKRIAALEQGNANVTPRPVIVPPMNWVDLDNLPTVMTKTLPSHLRLSDGTEKQVRSWRQALLIACESVLVSNTSISLPLADSAGASKTLIDYSKLPHSSQLKDATGKTVFVHLLYNSNGYVANIRYILKQMPANKQIIKPAVVFRQV
jgi:hypothetical protein